MRRLIAVLAAAAVAASAIAAAAQAPPAPERVVAAYFADYDAPYNAYDIPASRLTDVIYAFGAVTRAGRCTLADPYADTREAFPGVPAVAGAPAGDFGALLALKRRFPNLATEISIGGGGSGSSHFSAAASTPARRARLVSSCIALFLRRWPGLFDGVDIDWEFPVAGGDPGTPARPADRADATALIALFRRELDTLGASAHRHYLLTAAMPSFRTPDGSYTPSLSWDLPAVIGDLDWINLMTYNLTDASSPVTDFESPLRRLASDPSPAAPNGGDTIEGAVSFYEAAGVPAEKIVIGAPFYGHVFTHVPGRHGGLFQRFRRQRDTPTYDEIASAHPSSFRRYWSPTAGEPWLYSHQLRQFVSYEDPASMAAKAGYVIAAHLRGAMVWEISQDDAAHSLIDALSGPLLGTRP